MSKTEPVLRLRDVRYRWPGRDGFALAIDDLSVVQGERVLLLGESGSGKSTLLSLICGTIIADRGEVRLLGSNLADLTAGQRDRFRAEHIGLIFQQFNLLPYGRVLDNIALPLRFAPARRARVPDPQETAARLCAELGLPRDILKVAAGRLSVGQQQRVAAARALIGAPSLIVADEPTSALDAATQDTFLKLLFAQTDVSGGTLVMVSHDARLAPNFDRVLQMSEITASQVAL